MTLLALIRHGETAWNVEHRLQGRSDIGLSPQGLAEMKALAPPPELGGATWLTSPLRRARQTAALLNGGAAVEDRLIEAHWGAWEGLTDAVTERHAARLRGPGRSGLDFFPPGGESPRDVQRRLAPLLADLAAADGPFVAVTHRGVIRALLSLAIGWDMEEKAPVKLRWRAAHLFEIAPGGGVTLRQPNLMLPPRP